MIKVAVKHAAIFMCFVALFVVVLVGGMTAKDLDDAEALYCQGVNEQWHPDYKKIYDKVCKAVDTE